MATDGWRNRYTSTGKFSNWFTKRTRQQCQHSWQVSSVQHHSQLLRQDVCGEMVHCPRTGVPSIPDDTWSHQKCNKVFQGAWRTCEDAIACLQVLRSPADIKQETVLPTDGNAWDDETTWQMECQSNANTMVKWHNCHLAISDSNKNY